MSYNHMTNVGPQLPAGIKKVSDVHYEFLGANVRAGSIAFTIDGRWVKICAVGMRYFDAPADNDSIYIAFKFIIGPGCTVESGKAWLITMKRFVREAKLYERPVEEKFVTIGQLMEKNGAPCEAGCRALYGYLHGLKNSDHASWSRDKLIVEITKHSMRNGSWNTAIRTQSLYDWYTKNMGTVPYDYLAYIAMTIGVENIGANRDISYPHGSKSYDMLCRALGIKP